FARWRHRQDAVGRAAIASATIFALAHLLNLLDGHQPLRVGAQILWAFVLGVAFALLAWLVRSAWPGAIIHVLLDAVVHTNRIGQDSDLSVTRALVMVLVSLPVLVYAI